MVQQDRLDCTVYILFVCVCVCVCVCVWWVASGTSSFQYVLASLQLSQVDAQLGVVRETGNPQLWGIRTSGEEHLTLQQVHTHRHTHIHTEQGAVTAMF